MPCLTAQTINARSRAVCSSIQKPACLGRHPHYQLQLRQRRLLLTRRHLSVSPQQHPTRSKSINVFDRHQARCCRSSGWNQTQSFHLDRRRAGQPRKGCSRLPAREQRHLHERELIHNSSQRLENLACTRRSCSVASRAARTSASGGRPWAATCPGASLLVHVKAHTEVCPVSQNACNQPCTRPRRSTLAIIQGIQAKLCPLLHNLRYQHGTGLCRRAFSEKKAQRVRPSDAPHGRHAACSCKEISCWHADVRRQILSCTSVLANGSKRNTHAFSSHQTF